MSKEHSKTALKVASATVGLVFLIALYLFLFGEDEPMNESTESKDSDSWKNFKTEVVKDEHDDAPGNRGEYLDEALEKDRQEKDQEKLREREQERRGKTRIKHSDLSALLNESKEGSVSLLNDRKEESVSSNKEKQPDSYQENNYQPQKTKKKSRVGTRTKAKKKENVERAKAEEPTEGSVVRPTRRRRKKAPGVTLWGDRATTTSDVQSFEALIHEDQKADFSGGKQITIRFLGSTPVGDSKCVMKANQLYSARIMGVRGSRLELQVKFLCDGKRYVYNAWDDDGEEGIYIDNLSVDEETGKSIVSDVIEGGAQTITNKLGVGAVTNVVSSILSARGKKALEVTISSGKKIRFVRS